MKLRLLLLPALAFVVFSAQASTVIYNTFVGSTHFTHTVPRFRMADSMSTLAPPPGMWWRVNMIYAQFLLFPGTHGDVSARIRVYNDWNPHAGAAPAFSGLASDTTWNIAQYNIWGPHPMVLTMNFAFQERNLDFDLVDGQSMGVSFTWMVDGVPTSNATTGICLLGPEIGTSTFGFYQDLDNNGVLVGDERRHGHHSANLMMQIRAEAVPEPATLLVLGAGAAALAARRRRKK